MNGGSLSLQFFKPRLQGYRVKLTFGEDVYIPAPPWEPPGPGVDGALPYGLGTAAASELHGRWHGVGSLSGLAMAPWRRATAKPGQVVMLWSRHPIAGTDAAAPWSVADLIEADCRWPWRSLTPADTAAETPWGKAEPIQIERESPWRGVSPRPAQIRTPWEIPTDEGHALASPWRQPPSKTLYPSLPWGIGDPIASLRYVEPPPPPPPPPPYPPDRQKGHKVILLFWKERQQGRAVTLRFGEIPLFYGRSIIVNTASVVRLPDLTPIPCNAVGLEHSEGDWGWSFRGTALSQAALDLVKPQADGTLTDLRVTLNGWQWVVTVQGWDRSRQFGANAWSITGCSPAIRLTRPYSATRARLQASTRTAQQLANEELEGSGWTVDWTIDDWTVPGGVWSYEEQTSLSAVIEIAAAPGAEVVCHRTGQILQIKPRYPVPTWNWETATPDKTILDSQTVREGTAWEDRPEYDAVFCTGDRTGGKVVRAVRDGTSGNNVAPNFTHALITDSIPARQKATEVFSWSGPKQTVTRVLPLYPDPYQPGLLARGMLVDIGGQRGLVRSVRLEASRVPSGDKSALVITQTVQVECRG